MINFNRNSTFLRSNHQHFGNYSCAASNLMGTSRCFMELNGRPFNLSFYSSELQGLASPHYHQVRLPRHGTGEQCVVAGEVENQQPLPGGEVHPPLQEDGGGGGHRRLDNSQDPSHLPPPDGPGELLDPHQPLLLLHLRVHHSGDVRLLSSLSAQIS